MQCHIVCRIFRYDISVLTVNMHRFFYRITSAFFIWHKPQIRILGFCGIKYGEILCANNDRLDDILLQNGNKKSSDSIELHQHSSSGTNHR